MCAWHSLFRSGKRDTGERGQSGDTPKPQRSCTVAGVAGYLEQELGS